MYYSDFVMPGSYLAHHGIKGQKWGVRRFQDSHVYAKNRKAYKEDLTNKFKSSSNKKETFRTERNNIVKGHIKSSVKSTLALYGASTVIGIGAGIVGGIVGGPAGAIAANRIAIAGSAALSTIYTGQRVVNWVNTISKGMTLADLHSDYVKSKGT
jgi:hypothetical protein